MSWYWILLLIVVLANVGILLVRNAVSPVRAALQNRRPLLRRHSLLYRMLALSDLEVTINQWLREQEQYQQESREQRLRAETILNQIQEGVLILNDSHEVVLANPAFGRLLQQQDSLTGRRVERIFPSGEFLDLLRQVKQVGRGERDIEMVRTEGKTEQVLQVSGASFVTNDTTETKWLLLLMRDITRQHRLEQLRRDFVANVSHELRTPLTIIKGYVETLQNSGSQISDTDRDRFLQKIASNTERLHRLLEDLLALSRLESSQVALQYETMDFNSWLEGLAMDFAGLYSRESHRLELDLEPDLGEIRADPVKLSRVVENLLDNAFKYGPASAAVVKLRARREEGRVLVSICDQGRGIPAEDLPHIFERFFRVDKGRARIHGGSGLGLSIAKHIIKLHGGEIGAESKVGEGTCIHFSIPTRIG